MNAEKILDEVEYILLESEPLDEDFVDATIEMLSALHASGYALRKNIIEDAEEVASVEHEIKDSVKV